MARQRRGFRLGLGRRSDTKRALEDEIHAHLEMRVEELVAKGFGPDAAREEAVRRFGDLNAARRRLYTQARKSERRLRRRDRWSDWSRDLSYAMRQARRSPGFTATAVAILALGVGLTTGMFTLVDHVLLRALPFPQPDALVSLQSVPSGGGSFNLTSVANWVDWREGNTTLAATALYRAYGAPATVDTGSEVISVAARDVSGQFFEALSPSMAWGRPFSEAEGQEGLPVVVVSEGFWRTVLGADPDLANRPLTVNGERVRVIGVVRGGREFPGGTQLWSPFGYRAGSGAMRNNINWSAIGRLRPGITPERSQADLSAIARGIMERDPEAAYSHGVRVLPLADVVVESAKQRLTLLMGAALFVLLVACANLAGLSLARARSREHEVVVRLTLGAGRLRVLRQIVTEHALLALAGGAIGVLGAGAMTGIVTRALQASLPRAQEVGFDVRVALVGLAAALASGVVAGTLPAWQASRRKPGSLLSGARGRIGGRRGSPGAVLVGGQVALAVLLVTGGGLLVRSFQTVVGRDLGYDPGPVLTMEIRLTSSEYGQPDRALTYWETLLDDLRNTPGVARAGMANWIPTSTGGTGWIELADQPDHQAGAGYRIVSDDYFEALGVPLLEGRVFDDRDAARGDRSVLINQRMAETLWEGRSPLGQRLKAVSMEQWLYESQGLDPWLTVIGVVGNLRHHGFEADAEAEMYVLHRQIPQRLQSMTAVVRASGPDVGSVAVAVRERAVALDPTLAISVEPLNQRLEGLLATRRLFMLVLSTFALLAVVLACIGVYGLLSFVVSERTREFAVRAALGAEHRAIVLLTLRRAMPILAGGALVGLGGAVGLSGYLEAQLVEVTPSDPLTYALAAGLLIGVAMLAALLPARRAAGLDPVDTLRQS